MIDAPLEYDKPVRISALATRVLADNSSFMTGPGTNTYLVGRQEIAVIDPGPQDSRHVDAIFNAVEPPGSIKWILISHTHPDHSPAAKMLQEKTGAPILGRPPPGGNSRDSRFAPDQLLHHNERIQTGEFCLQAIHTPGHTSNHLCFLLENENLIFTGDHIMQGSTVVIMPPHGHMQDYLNSLEAIKAYSVDRIAPGHGNIMDNPVAVIDGIINHRLEREAKVLSALKGAGRARVDQLLPTVYDDVPLFKHFVAAFSLESHLIKLEEDGIAERENDLWRYRI